MTKKEIYDEANSFLKDLFEDIKRNKLIINSHWDIDHICYRSDSIENYEDMKLLFLKFGTLLTESEINGRPISTFKLHDSIVFKNWQIPVIELPAPKKGKVIQRGFEHIEIVFDLSFDEFQKINPQLHFDLKGLSKTFNTELEVCLESGNIKFHHSSLESVIQIENNTRVWTALQESKILELFKENNPLIIGDIPLGIETNESELIILLGSNELEKFENDFKKNYSKLEGYRQSDEVLDGHQCLSWEFILKGVRFKIYGQELETVKTLSYKCFLEKERSLKVGDTHIKEKILNDDGSTDNW